MAGSDINKFQESGGIVDREISFHLFGESDLSVYRDWFSDHELSSRIDFPTNAWFQYINSQSSHCWAAIADGLLVAVLQIDGEIGGPASMDIAIKPDLRALGLGKKVLQAFLSKVGCNYSAILASIQADNLASLACFSSCGFEGQICPDHDGFIELNFSTHRAGIL